jgi:hypothetical protein
VKLKLILTTAIVGVALALPSTSNAAPPSPPPTQDSVTLTGGPAEVGFFTFTVLAIDATSGPSGEDPSGQVDFFVFPDTGSTVHIQGPVTCLAVTGNTATINVEDQIQSVFGIVTVQVVDDQLDTFDALPIGRAPTDCSPPPPSGLPTALFAGTGDITVVDAQPPPTNKEQCKKGGWRNFPQFKNQGQCVAFVNHDT